MPCRLSKHRRTIRTDKAATGLRRVVAGAVLSLGAAVVQADDGGRALEEVQVQAGRLQTTTTATLSATPLFELPLSVTQLAVEDFPDRLPKDIADLADYSAGVSRRANYWGVNTPTFQLRGFNAGDGSAYYKDGFRYQGRGPLSMANVTGIEILRGPQSAVYGWLDPGGAVQIGVKQPSPEPIRTASLQMDGWGKTGVSVDMGGALDARTSFRFVAAREQGGSFRDHQNGEQTLLAPSLAWQFSGGRQLQLSLELLDDTRTTDYGIPGIDGAPARVPVSRVYTEAWGQQHSRSLRLSSRWTDYAFGGRVALAMSYYSLKYLEYRDVEPYRVTGNMVQRWYENYPERYRWLTFHGDWSRSFQGELLRHDLTARIEMARETRSLKGGELDEYPAIDAYAPVHGQAWSPTTEFARYDQAWRNLSAGLVLQDEIRRGNWTLLLGGRVGYLQQTFNYADHLPLPYREHSVQDDFSITPRIGLTWRLTPGIALYTNYAAGNMPTLPQSRSYAGESFIPLNSRQWESGLKTQSGDGRWQASVAWFEITRNNVLTIDPEHPGYSIQTGRQRSRGIELQWQGQLHPGWQLTTQATWLDAFIEEDNRYARGNHLPYAASFSTSAWLTHRLADLARGQCSVSGGFVYQGERFADFANTVQLPGYTRIDLGASYREHAWSATLALENATNQRYYSSGVENRPAVIYPGPPRMLSLRLTRNFN